MCPICHTQLNQTVLVPDLPAYKCSNCEGIWISANEYFAWQQNETRSAWQSVDFTMSFEIPFPVSDNDRAILCPDCGRLLRRYRIWPNIQFNLDRCSHCNGIWFDRNEWQTLQAQNLHTTINMFFTETWQKQLRGEEIYSRFDKMYLALFGQDDYQKIKEVRLWLNHHPNGSRLLAFLTDRDPYKG